MSGQVNFKCTIATVVSIVIVIVVIIYLILRPSSESYVDDREMIEHFPTSEMNVMYTDANGNLSTTQDLGLKNLTVSSTSKFGSDVGIVGNASVGGKLSVTGDVGVAGNAAFVGNTVVGGDTTSTGHLYTKKNLYVSGDSSINGTETVNGTVNVTKGVNVSLGDGSSIAQYRAKHGNYGTLLRQDGSTFYISNTANGDPNGGWSDKRPFYIDNASGNVGMNHNVSIGGSLTASSISTNGTLSAGTASVTSLTASSMSTNGTLTAGNTTVGNLSAGTTSVGSLTASSMSTNGTLTAGNTTVNNLSAGATSMTSLNINGVLSAGNTTLGNLNVGAVTSSGSIVGKKDGIIRNLMDEIDQLKARLDALENLKTDTVYRSKIAAKCGGSACAPDKEGTLCLPGTLGAGADLYMCKSSKWEKQTTGYAT